MFVNRKKELFQQTLNIIGLNNVSNKMWTNKIFFLKKVDKYFLQNLES